MVVRKFCGEKTLFKKLSAEEKAYLAGFLDGDGSIILQIVKDPQSLYGFRPRISVSFFQKKCRHWFIIWLKKHLGNLGYLRNRKDGISEYTISGARPVAELLILLLPYLRMKKNLAKLALSIIERNQQVQNWDDFLEVCKLIDKAVQHTDSKKRVITSKLVEESLKSPVETLLEDFF